MANLADQSRWSLSQKADFPRAMSVDRDDWSKEIVTYDNRFIRLNVRIPNEMFAIYNRTLSAL